MTAVTMVGQGMDQHENVRGAFTRSVFFHVSIIGGLMLYAYLNAQGDRFGAEDAGSKAVGVVAVDSIPLPSHGPENPVANDTESEVPQEIAKPAPKEVAEPEPKEAIALLPPERKTKQALTPKNRLKSFDELPTNQLTSKSPQAASTPLFSGQTGGSRIGVTDTTLGNRFPGVQDVDPSVTSAPSVTIRFELLKDGRATQIRLVRRSNVPSLDLSVQNAVEETNYPPLPPGYDKESVPVEFTFELKR